jgi:hypothetical protein
VAYRAREGRAPRFYRLTGTREQGKPSCICLGRRKADQAMLAAVAEFGGPIGCEIRAE